ncbi:hypothetical protein SAMN06265353_0178 [Hydrogenobacter hydrogenophilus]|uniref:Uncharacterized protein n=2 Tax=Hydrogenobacter hydrogenophilus TaxID=35835 RepID=A0A285NU98_9AQUI|nr:hypothetical protein SAMN06265353_0178 [Hydrogenobacter hydrogenophilus]
MAFKQAYSKSFEIEKPVVGYARFGRVLKFNKYLFLLQLTLLVFVFEFLVIFFLEDYFKVLSNIARRILEDSYTGSYKFLNLTLEYSVSHGRLPTLQESFTYLILSLLFLLFLIRKLNPLPKYISAWFIYIAFVYFVSSCYFVLFLDSFPYTERDFATLYILQQMGVFIFIPFVLGLSLSIFTFSWLNLLLNAITISLSLMYSSVFGGVRYIVFAYILKNFSYIHMPAMFFLFGPLLDFIYIVSFYSLCLYMTLRLLQKRREAFYQWGF